jgi:hypothetical protein
MPDLPRVFAPSFDKANSNCRAEDTLILVQQGINATDSWVKSKYLFFDG